MKKLRFENLFINNYKMRNLDLVTFGSAEIS